MPPSPAPHRGILLLGPTGSGKTPLGAEIERRGLGGAPCRHFDFGEQLRRIVARGTPDDVATADDLAFLRSVLTTGALLEDEHFPLAQRILQAFLAEPGRQEPDRPTATSPVDKSPTDGRPEAESPTLQPGALCRTDADAATTCVILNGLPRHVGQARGVESLVEVRAVVALECEPEVVLQRIRRDTGGDRAGRIDDATAAVRAKLALFAERTAPLIEHFRQAGARVVAVRVTAEMTPAVMYDRLPPDLLARPSGASP